MPFDWKLLLIVGLLLHGSLLLFFGIAFFVLKRKQKAQFALNPTQKKQLRAIVQARFGDPLAQQIEWTPLTYGGSPSKTQRITFPGRERIGFRLAPIPPENKKTLVFTVAIGYLFPAFIALFGEPSGGAAVAILFTPIWAVPLALVAFLSWRYRRRFLDSRLGRYRIGTKKGRLQQIRALQIVAQKTEDRVPIEKPSETPENKPSWNPDLGLVSREEKRWWTHELNVVLEDRKRLNLMAHGDADSLRSDALKISKFLDVPVWDSTIQ